MKLIDKLLNVLFPDKLVCDSCGREAVVQENGLCIECCIGTEVFNAAPALEFVDGFTAAYIYNDVSGRMVKRLKYNGAKYLARPLAEAVKLPEDWHIDAVVPVPLYYRREAKRGYNQSELIARHIAQINELKLDPSLLVRTHDTKQQARMSEAGRRRNVKDAFLADEGCKGLDILLVDDVRTTGSTLRECAKELKRCGCGKVYAAAVCFADKNKGGAHDGV